MEQQLYSSMIIGFLWERIIDVTRDRGFIDFRIPRYSMAEQVFQTLRRKRHRSEIFSKIEEVIETQRRKQHTNREDIVL